MSGAQDVLGAAGTAINLNLVDLICSLVFSIVPPTAVYMDLWVIMASFKQTNLQKNEQMILIITAKKLRSEDGLVSPGSRKWQN